MQTKKNSIPFYYILNKTTMANEIDIISFKIVIVVVTSIGSNHNLMVTIWNAMFHWNDMPTHTSCTQNIMDEKWGHSMVNSTMVPVCRWGTHKIKYIKNNFYLKQ